MCVASRGSSHLCSIAPLLCDVWGWNFLLRPAATPSALPVQRFSPVCSRPKITIWVTPSSFSAAIISRFAAWLQKRRRTVAGARSQHSSDITAAGRRDYPLFFPSILPLFHPSVWKRKDAAPLLPGGCLVWGLVSVCCDSWGSHESGVDSLAPPPTPARLPHLLHTHMPPWPEVWPACPVWGLT